MTLSFVDKKFDERASEQKPVAATPTIACAAGTGVKTVNGSTTLSCNGKVYGYKYTAKDLTTDTTFTITIVDPDGCVWLTLSGLADNTSSVPTFGLLAEDSRVLLCSDAIGAGYTVTWTWTTSQNIAAGDLKVALYFL